MKPNEICRRIYPRQATDLPNGLNVNSVTEPSGATPPSVGPRGTESYFSALQKRLRGKVIGYDDAGYDRARRIWNGRIDRRPRLIAQCLDAGDIIACVRFARERALRLAVRGNGHAVAGTAICQDGLVVDLSMMKSVRVNPQKRTARVGSGVTLGELDHATQAFGLAVPVGTDSKVGISGLTLGGGNGWLMGAFGATCDNLLSVDLVTADGNFLTASEDAYEDLFWAVRGGGGNFGIATSLKYRAHRLGPEVVAGTLLYPLDQARDVLRQFRSFAHDAPDPLTVYPCLIFLDNGTPVLCMAACYAGPVDEGKRAVIPLKQLGRPITDQLQPMSFLQWQSSLDAARPFGRRCAIRSHFLKEIDDDFIDVLVEGFKRAPSRLSAVILEHCHGAIARVPVEATAFALRKNPYHFEILAFWDNPQESEANLRWTMDYFAETSRFSSQEVYVNSLDEDEGGRIREAYGPNYERLRQIKRKYDPENFFHCNQNIIPASIG
jgi:FAD/FMN-containing dehydrogenase